MPGEELGINLVAIWYLIFKQPINLKCGVV